MTEQDDCDFDEYETGPFCRHWSDPSMCDELCANCGHRCTEHEFDENGACMVDGCDCCQWKDAIEDDIK